MSRLILGVKKRGKRVTVNFDIGRLPARFVGE